MSDDTVSQPEDTVSRAEFANLQEQLKTARAERDRQIFEKSEIVAKANACSKERDDLKEQLASILTERDKIIGDVVADHDKIVADITSQRDGLAMEKAALAASLQGATRRAEEASRRADEAAAEIQRLRGVIDAAPPSDLVAVFWALLSQKTKAAVAWVRGKIPADSPLLPWFDKTVETVTKVGCIAVTLTVDFVRWATPKVIDLSKQGIAKVEEMLAKK
ncbi:hypothetical protein [Methylocystis sp. ATCC 49242]|uniref:hypothetical protein n=1 Tax=Methylocystis sp. ATCC 49242 TaxID=622637 RepID=UPI0001F88007|nr:hypothetical protein [Methylocystis sp. ATCC 49242]